jgi:hypothetical protein
LQKGRDNHVAPLRTPFAWFKEKFASFRATSCLPRLVKLIVR